MIGLLILCLLVPAAPEKPDRAGTVARVTRIADPVAALDTQARDERMLFHWDKSASIVVGDGVRQGVAGISELFFFDDKSLVRSFGEATMFVTAADDQRHVIRADACARLAVESKEIPLTIELPGGTVLEAKQTFFRVQLDDLGRKWLIRNAGGGEIKVSGVVPPAGTPTIAAGHEMSIPVPVAPGDPVAQAAGATDPANPSPGSAGGTVDVWRGSTIRLGPGLHATKKDEDLELEGPGVAQVGGARLVLEDGSRVTVWRPEP